MKYKQAPFAKLLGISERQLRLLENGSRVSQEILSRINSALTENGWASEAAELMSSAGHVLARPKTMDGMDFNSLAKVLRKADERVLKSIRDHNREFFSEDELAREHNDLLEISLKNEGLVLSEFLARIQDIRFLEKLSQTVVPQLQIHVGDLSDGRFTSLKFAHNSRMLISLTDTDLLWPCWCASKITSGKTCPIHSHINGKEVENRFSNGLVEICWRGFKFLWKDGREAWPPSIDAFVFIETLEKAEVFRKSARTLLDAGSGTGFLGIIASHLSESLSKIILWDWLLTPALYGQINWYRNRKNDHMHSERDYVSACPVISLFCEAVRQSSPPIPSDIVLCNPPYLPIPEKFKKLSFESTTSGTVLLEQIISNSRNLGRDVYLQFSKLASVEAKACAKKAAVRLLPVGKTHSVPCRIRDAINNPRYLEFLKQPRRGLALKNRGYGHKICAYVVA